MTHADIDAQNNEENETVNGVPYKFTLENTEPNAFTVDHASYKVRIKSNVGFKIVGIDNGSFEGAFISSGDTVIFTTDKLFHGEKKTGVAAVLFDDKVPETQRKLAFDISVYVATINAGIGKNCNICLQLYPFEEIDQSKTITIGPETTSYFTIITSIAKLGKEVLDLISGIYDKVTPCFNLSVISNDPNLDSRPEYDIIVKNCSEHPQTVRLSVGAPPNAAPVFTSDVFDLKSLDVHSAKLFFIINNRIADGEYLFNVRGDVLLKLFDRSYVVASSNGSNTFIVKHENGNMVVVPEFGVLSVFILALGVVLSVLVVRRWEIIIMKMKYIELKEYLQSYK